jgi:MFS family permease
MAILPDQPDPGRSSWSVLRYRDFRLMYFAQMLAVTGGAMQLAAINWHVWSLTTNEAALGLLGLVRVGPIIALSLLGGVVSDAIDRRRLLVITQIATFLSAAILALSVLTGNGTLPIIYLLTAMMAGIGAFESPARYALLPSLIPENRIADAARLNVVLFTVTAVFGPLVASRLLAVAGPGITYAFNAASLIPSVLVLMIIRVAPTDAVGSRAINLQALKEGLSFVRHTPLLWSSMLLDFFATFFSSALLLLPVYADKILHVGLDGYGVLYAAPFAGSTLGALVMAQLGNRLRRQGEVLMWSVGLYGLATVVFGLSETFPISLLALAFTGLADSISAAIRNALRQTLTPSRLRGRMQSVLMIFFLGGPQLGEFEAGTLARLTSTQFSVVSGGIGTMIAVLLMAITVPVLRQYRELPQPVTD